MTKRDLVVRIARQTNLKQRDVMDVLQLALDAITSELAAGRGVEFRNFGVFEVMARKPRVGRNPNQPKKTVDIPERVVVKFKPGKIMRGKVMRLKPEMI
ncbi:MAG: integration host factor subunit beta [Lentisphaeria bacterium]|nr:integration host factor subunit beta [Lentisphaeria bacterium]